MSQARGTVGVIPSPNDQLARITAVEDLKEWILKLPDVTTGPHRFGGIEYRFHNLEFMHSHGPTHLDIRLSKEDQERMLKEGKARPHLYAPQAGYVTFHIRSEKDLEVAQELVQLAYKNTGNWWPLTRK